MLGSVPDQSAPSGVSIVAPLHIVPSGGRSPGYILGITSAAETSVITAFATMIA